MRSRNPASLPSYSASPLNSKSRSDARARPSHDQREFRNETHNAATQPAAPKSEVGKRAENQQDRIANGIASGKLSAAQTAKLEKGESNINKEVAADRAANGGKLTAAEKKQVNRQQNQMSRRIYRDKHN